MTIPSSRALALVALLAAAAAPSLALAQDEGAVTPPKHACKKSEYPGNLASERQVAQWRREMDGFADCIKKYVAQQQKNAEAFIKAGNEAIDEYNNAVKSANTEMKQ